MYEKCCIPNITHASISSEASNEHTRESAKQNSVLIFIIVVVCLWESTHAAISLSGLRVDASIEMTHATIALYEHTGGRKVSPFSLMKNFVLAD